MNTCIRSSAVALCSLALASANANAVTIDFDSLADLETLTTQFTGITFANATALKAGFSLNEVEFPPHSGTLVISDEGAPIDVRFATPVTQASAYFTYFAPLTLTAFDALDNVLGSAVSAFTNNLALSGDPDSSANELLQLAFASGISRLMLAGDPAGYSFVVDDLSYTPLAQPMPEPVTAALVAIGLAGLLARRRFATA